MLVKLGLVVLVTLMVIALGNSLPSKLQKQAGPACTRKTLDGTCCVFPFQYKGKPVHKCGKYNHNKAWCATTSNYDRDNKWGVCAPSTPPLMPFDRIMIANNDARNAKSRQDNNQELFQGDILLNDETKYNIYTFMNARGVKTPWDGTPPADPARKSGGRSKRAVMRTDNMRWMRSDGRQGEVPYYITASNSRERTVIQRAIHHWQTKVPCLKFVPVRPSSRSRKYLSFFSGGGCYSMVGRQRGSGAQKISIGRGCGHMGVVVHEIGHALGFWHEQSRPDRDRFVTIYWRNIQSGMAFNFHKYTTNKINSRGVSYDYSSVMHYGSTAFANRRGVYTIKGKDGRTNLGQRYGLSAKDIQQANALYCGRSPPRPTTQPPRPPTQPPRPPTPPPPGGCRYTDKHRWCRFWKARNYCASSSRYSTYMANNCEKSCKCIDSWCGDKFQICRKWASLGHCRSPRFGKYVQAYCKKSCGLCP